MAGSSHGVGESISKIAKSVENIPVQFSKSKSSTEYMFCRAGKIVSSNKKNRRRTFHSGGRTFHSEIDGCLAERTNRVDRGMESLTEEWKVSLRFFHIPGPLTFQPYRCIFSICGASTYHRSCLALLYVAIRSQSWHLWMPPVQTSFMDSP